MLLVMGVLILAVLFGLWPDAVLFLFTLAFCTALGGLGGAGFAAMTWGLTGSLVAAGIVGSVVFAFFWLIAMAAMNWGDMGD